VQFFVLRKLIEHAWVRKGYNHKHAYICSLSSHTIVYKGQLLPAQVPFLPHKVFQVYISQSLSLADCPDLWALP